MARLTFQRVRVATGSEDGDGVLALVDGELVAVLTRLDAPYHGDQRGLWHQECGFGRCDARPATFASLGEAACWIAARLGLAEEELGGAVEIGRAVSCDRAAG